MTGSSGIVEATPVAERELVVSATPATTPATGALSVFVRHGNGNPAPGVIVLVSPSHSDRWSGSARCSTDDAGRAHFEALRPGQFRILADRGGSASAEVIAGTTAEVSLDLPIGMMLTGVVVDSDDTPVAGALVEGAPRSRPGVDIEVLATTGSDGTFLVEGAPVDLVVGARAVGHRKSPFQLLRGTEGEPMHVRLRLGPAGGSVSGVVVDTRNRPIMGAVVCVGRGSTSRFEIFGNRAMSVPALARTDAEGRFLAFGIDPGPQPVVARAPGKGPVLTSCDVQAHVESFLRIELPDGATIRGIVSTTEGVPAPDAEIAVGELEDLANYRTVSAADGRFEVADLPAGEVSLRAKHSTAGRAQVTVMTTAGAVTTCDITLDRGVELRGRVVDDRGEPLSGAGVLALSTNLPTRWSQGARTDQDGSFLMTGCPSSEALWLRVNRTGFAEASQQNVDPRLGPIEIRMSRVAAPVTRIRGVIIDPAGSPLSAVRIYAFGPVRDGSCAATSAGDGHFELGPLVPGSWSLAARSTSYPIWRSEPFQLNGEAVYDLGQVQMPTGGRAIIDVPGDRANLKFTIYDAEDMPYSVVDTGTTLESNPLALGVYRLLVQGPSVAATSLPFTVRVGEQTTVRFTPQTGVRQRFVVPGGVPLMGLLIHIRRGSELVATVSMMPQKGTPQPVELWLVPGEYEAVVRNTEFAGSPPTRFTVGSTDGPPVSVALQ